MARRPGTLRIIGGQWRSRLIEFDAAHGVRPTPDRVRQTLFDWLAPVIHGATCLDLFAGSGALGLEALSRGAGAVHFVERGAAQVAAIRRALHELGDPRAEVVADEALQHLTRTILRYDVVFADPPYGSGLLEQVLPLLPRVLKPEARIYLEWSGMPPELPGGFCWLRNKRAGQVSYGLVTHLAASTGAGP